MNSLNTLRNLLYKLKKEEIKSLINFLKYHQKQPNDQSLKSIQLVRLIIADKSISANSAQVHLYGKLNYSAFNKLVIRLKDKIYEVLLFNNNLLLSDNYGKRNRTIFDLRKKLLQSEIMFSRGMNDELERFQNKIIQKAKEYEIYDTLLEALHSRQRFLGVKSGLTSNQKIKQEIHHYEQVRNVYNRSIETYNHIATKISASVYSSDYEQELEEAIMTLHKDFEYSNSALVGYYYLLFLTEQHQNKWDFLKSRETLNQLKELIEQNVSIYTKNRIGNVLINMANNEFLMYNFDRCLSDAKEALTYFSGIVVNEGIIKEVEFHALFHSNQLIKAEKLIEELYHASRSSKTPFLHSKRAYLLASLKTLKGEIKQSEKLLSEVSEIEKDKEGWNIGKRILIIINRIEMKDFESADLQVQNLEKHIKRTLKIKHVRKRDILILRILLKLINEQFDFQKVYNSRRRYFNLLESNDPQYRWQIKSPELIIFHEWFRSKMEKRPYNHQAIIEQERERSLALRN